jgi:hypothetical protein
MAQPDEKNPENAKVVLQMPPRGDTLAAIESVDQLEHIKAEAGQGSTDVTYVPGSVGALMTSGMPVKPSFAPGDKVYHKGRHKECVISRLGVDGRVRVKLLPKGDKVWVNPENLVRL